MGSVQEVKYESWQERKQRLMEEEGRKCPKKLERRQKCKLPACEEDCLLGQWQEWQACSQSCGVDGEQSRERTVQHQAASGGRPCAPKIQRRICLLEACPGL